jgi:small subunit ribosomal protein S27Ae
LKQQISEKTGVAVEEIVLIHGLSVLDSESTIESLDLQEEATITKPKKIGHKHKKRPKAILEYFNVDNTGKITKLKIECDKCPPATYMADHLDRYTCGKCGSMFYKLTLALVIFI